MITNNMKREGTRVERAGAGRDTLRVTARPPAQLRRAQVIIATLALESVDAVVIGDEARLLREALDCLGLCFPTTELPEQPRGGGTCGVETGTVRGYRRHLAAYQKPCADCLAARVAEREHHWHTLGISNTEEVVVP